MYKNIPDFLESVSKEHGDKTAFHIRRLFKTTKVSYSQVAEFSFKFAQYYRNIGLKKGDSIIMWAPNMPEWIIALLGALSIGVVVVPTGIHSTKELVKKYVKFTNPKLIIISKYLTPEFLGEIQGNSKVFYLEDLFNTIRNLEPVKEYDLDYKPEDLAEIVFTSGTTGEPKGVMISHKNMLSEIESLMATIPYYKSYRLLSLLPLSHVMEQVIGVFAPMTRGATVYYVTRLNTSALKKAMRKHQITNIGLVPQLLRMFLDDILFQVQKEKAQAVFDISIFIAKYLPFKLRRFLFRKIHNGMGGKLYAFGIGSAPLDVKVAKIWEALGVKIVEGYGASETTGAVTANTIDNRVLGSVGRILPKIEVKISSEGEILAKGNNVTSGYYNDSEKTAAAFDSDGFYKTGDIGFFDKQGNLRLKGRDKFKIITSSGDKVFPEDLERVLNNDPDIWDSCVFGLDKGNGEVVSASVILDKNSVSNVDDVIRRVNQKLETHQQILEYFVWPEKDFPRLHTLKVDRRLVKDISERKLSGPDVKIVESDHNHDKLYDIISIACKVDEAKITDKSILVSDFDLDSLKRVELVSLIEEEYEVEVDESLINQTTSVADLKTLISKESLIKETYNLENIVNFIKSDFGKNSKIFIQNFISFPILRLFIRCKVEGELNFESLPKPFVLVGNHPGPGDAISVLLSLPSNVRKNLALPADEAHWHECFFPLIVNGPIQTLATAGFPLDKRGGAIKKSLEAIADLLDARFSILIFPEGKYTEKDKKIGELKGGIELLLADTGIPLVPFYITGNLNEIFTPNTDKPGIGRLIPHGIARVKVKYGKPFYLTSTKDEKESLNLIQEKILELN